MNNKNCISDYTEQEFIAFLRKIFNADYESEEAHTAAVHEFERLSQHPDGMDVIYYPKPGQDDSPEGVVEVIKAWRSTHGLPGFKVEHCDQGRFQGELPH